MKKRGPDSRSPKSFWDEQHKLVAAQPFAWVHKADELLAAFEVLVARETANEIHHPPYVSHVAYMLAGFAIEVLMKGILVRTYLKIT